MKLRVEPIRTPGGTRWQVQYESKRAFNNRRHWKVAPRGTAQTHTYITQGEAEKAMAELNSTIKESA